MRFITTLAALVLLSTSAAHAANSHGCKGGATYRACMANQEQAQQQRQSQGQHQGQVQGQSQSSNNSNSNDNTNVNAVRVSISQKAIAAAASAYANAPATANPCALSAGAGYQDRVFGISISFSHEADECEVIRAADALQRHGQFKAALIMLCTDPRARRMGDAMRQAGTCRVTRALSLEPVFGGKY